MRSQLKPGIDGSGGTFAALFFAPACSFISVYLALPGVLRGRDPEGARQHVTHCLSEEQHEENRWLHQPAGDLTNWLRLTHQSGKPQSHSTSLWIRLTLCNPLSQADELAQRSHRSMKESLRTCTYAKINICTTPYLCSCLSAMSVLMMSRSSWVCPPFLVPVSGMPRKAILNVVLNA